MGQGPDGRCLKSLLRYDIYPRQMLDSNLAADEGKLDYLAQVASGKDAVVDLIRQDQPFEVKEIRDRFTLRELVERSAQDRRPAFDSGRSFVTT